MKKFIFTVGTWEYEDTEPLGTGFEKAKAVAEFNHLPIFRTVIEEREEVMIDNGFFVLREIAPKNQIKIF